MESSRVNLYNWPDPPTDPGGWVAPHGDPIQWWKVVRVHACYIAPRIPFDATDDAGRPLKPRPELHAYHIDLAGDGWELPDLDNVLLYQEGRARWWWIKTATAEHLARIEKYRVA